MGESKKIVNPENLNFRNELSIYYEAIECISKNIEVEVVPQNDGWILVRYKDTLGLVSNKYLSDKVKDIDKCTENYKICQNFNWKNML